MIGRPKWWRRKGSLAWALLPVGFLYAVLDALNRLVSREEKAALPLVCIGNLTVGGAGKTPVTQAIAKLLLEKGEVPAIISRGFGRADRSTVKVDLAKHSAKEVGDEPLLHAKICETYVGSNRAAAVQMAAEDGATVAVLDDGLQHHKIRKDFVLEVRNHRDGLGNEFPLPAGPLRQWFGLGARGVDLVLYVGDERADAEIVTSRPEGIKPDAGVGAFCGIADPLKFQQTLEDLGIRPQWLESFPDHHQFSAADLEMLSLKIRDMQLVTTEKDWVRLPQLLQAEILSVPYAVKLRDPEMIWQKIKPLL